ncbi:MAG: aminopeptidase P family protein [Chloroflexi bacterium]|nr:aminopeptidase P family protein [Chloroflexota bacterium]
MKAPVYPVFQSEEYESRLLGVRARMAARGIDALVTTTPENIFYLSGYQTPGYYFFLALIVSMDKDPVLIPPPHEESLVAAYSWVDDYRIYPDTSDGVETALDVLRELGLTNSKVAIELGSWFPTSGDLLRLGDGLPRANVVDSNGLVEEGRLIKSEAELDQMRSAAAVSAAGMQAGLDAIREGVTERELAAEVYRAQILAGGEYSALPAFVTSGERSLLVHATWSDRRVSGGDVVFLEVPGTVNRYHAVHSRCAVIGDAPDLLQRGFEVNSDALRLAKEQIKPGVEVAEAFQVAKDRIDGADVPYTQGRRIAYGIGLAFPPDWGEGHIISINGNEHREFRPGMTFHVITTMRLPGLGAIGCSDTVAVTADGCETLTGEVPVEVALK